MSTTKAQKQEIYKTLQDRFKRMKSAVFAGYKGMTVASVSALRSELRKEGIDYQVAKKTLLQKAADEQGIEGFNQDVLTGPAAVAFSFTDEVAPAKLIKGFMKKDEKLTIFGGIFSGKMVDASYVKQMAALPSREVLLAQLLSTMNGSARGLVTCMAGPIKNFVQVLNALAEKKGTAPA